jgi:lysosomal acid lipase/cholesteryl ester hydrolase
MAALPLLPSALLLLGTQFVAVQTQRDEYNPDTHLSTPQLLTKYGYPVETHTVLTADGYLLTLHRIPYGRRNITQHRHPVILQHGVLASSADWVLLGPEKSLAYVLADTGYDVWMGNSRGNTYSRRHIKLTAKRKEFWNFSWHEMGMYDLPAVVDYILNATGETKLYYIGHSMGTTMFYVLLAEWPEYNSKVLAMFSLAPIAFLSHMTSPLGAFIINGGLEAIVRAVKNAGMFSFLPNSDLSAELGRNLCRDRVIANTICENIFLFLAGFGSTQINASMIPVILGHTPAGTSTKTFIHFAQLVKFGTFCQFDYGKGKNRQIYGAEDPPCYKLDNLKDIMLLYKHLPNPIGSFRVPLSQFNHLDFLWGTDVKTLVYDYVIEIMTKY